MVSMLVGVAAAAGGHLLWQRPSEPETQTALPSDREPGAYDSGLRRTGESERTDTPTTTTEPTTVPTTAESSAPAETPAETATTTTTRNPSPTRSARSTTASPEPAKPRQAGLSGATAEVVTLVNRERSRAGCAAVRVDADLVTAAQEHSDDMARRHYLSHTTPEGERFDERIADAGYSDPAAENIAMGISSAKAVMDAWMGSAGHRRNILNCDITAIGVGLNSSGWYWTQTFGY